MRAHFPRVPVSLPQGREPLEEWPPFPTEQLRPALHRSVWASLRELATLTVRLPPWHQEACCCDCMS